MKFADWKWTKGKESIEVKHGTAFVALGTTAGWVKWYGGKPIEYKVRQAGHRLPDRDELGDLEEDDWELGPDNKPKDPVGRIRALSTSSTRPVPRRTRSPPRAGVVVKLSMILPSRSSGHVSGNRARRLLWNFTPSLG